MQEYKKNKIVDAAEGEVNELSDKLKADLSSGQADRATIAFVEIGQEFELNGLRFKVTRKHSRGRIVAKLIGIA